MSSEKLPPIAICSRREKTMMGLNIQRSLKSGAGCVSETHTMSDRSRYLLEDAIRVYTSHKNGFLPEDPIKSSSKRINSISPRVSYQRDVYLNEGMSSYRKNYNSTKLPGSGVKMESMLALSKNIPENITLRRENTKLFMAIKSNRKSKQRPVAKFAQFHKLGLDQTFVASTFSDSNKHGIVSPKAVNNETYHSTDDVETSNDHNDSHRNDTQQFRVKRRSGKKCLFPVQFQPNGLPLEIRKTSNMEVFSSIAKENGKTKLSPSGESTKTNGTKTIQLIDELSEVIPDIVKLKHETRDLYPMFDWTQQRKEDVMKKRFLDPVLKTFNTECSDSDNQRSGKNANGKGRQLRDDPYQFTPDRRHIELESKLMSQYRQHYRRMSHDVTGMRSPSFSPLLNPPPTAMEFNIFDLESLLELDRAPSPLIPLPLEIKLDNVTSGAPAVNGVGCQPVSTAMVWSFKTKPTDATPNAENASDLIDKEQPDLSVCENKDLHKTNDTENRYEEYNHIVKDHPIDVIEESPLEHPVQVVIKIISEEDNQTEALGGSHNVVTNANSDVSRYQGGSSHTVSLGNFLNVPRVDVSFEERIPGPHTNRTTTRQSVSFSNTDMTSGLSQECKQERPQNPSPQKQSTTNPQPDERKLVSNKSIVFISPVL